MKPLGNVKAGFFERVLTLALALVLSLVLTRGLAAQTPPFEAVYSVETRWATLGTLSLRLHANGLLEARTTPQGLFAFAGDSARVYDRVQLYPSAQGWQARSFSRAEGNTPVATWQGNGPPDPLGAMLNIAQQLTDQQRQGTTPYRDLAGKPQKITWKRRDAQDTMLQLPYGALQTLHIEQQDTHRHTVHSWHAPALGHLAVQISTFGSTTVHLRLTTFRWY